MGFYKFLEFNEKSDEYTRAFAVYNQKYNIKGITVVSKNAKLNIKLDLQN
jgi:hypothetical protein